MKKTRIILIIVILLLIISILLLITFAFNSKKNNKSDEELYINDTIADLEGKLYPDNFYEFHFKYQGKIDTNVIYTGLYNIVYSYIPAINRDTKKVTDDKALSDYYNKNCKCRNKVELEGYENFKKLAQSLKKVEPAELEFESAEIVKSSVKLYSDRTEFNLKVKYKKCKEMLFKIKVYNTESRYSYIKYIPITGE